MKKLFSLLIPFLFLISCSSLSNSYEKDVMLKKHLLKWEDFRLNGIIELNYKQFAFRKNIFIRKEMQKVNLKIFDGGIFGMNAKPFLSAQMDSMLWVTNSTGDKTAYDISNLDGLKFLQNPQLIHSYKNDIIYEQLAIIENNIFIHFSDKMEITKIEQQDSNYEIEFVYNPELSQIIVTESKKVLLKIDVDKISYERK